MHDFNVTAFQTTCTYPQYMYDILMSECNHIPLNHLPRILRQVHLCHGEGVTEIDIWYWFCTSEMSSIVSAYTHGNIGSNKYMDKIRNQHAYTPQE